MSGVKPLHVGVDLRTLENPSLRGFTRYCLELVSALHERKDIRLTGFTDRPLAHDCEIDVVKVHGRSELIREQVQLPLLLRKLDIDVFFAPANRGLPLVAPCPTVVTLHDAVEWNRDLAPRPRGRHRFRFAYSNLATLMTARAIITPSRFSRDALERELRIDDKRIHVVHEAASASFSTNTGATESGHNDLLYVGGFDKKKDLATLIRAFAIVAREQDVTLTIAGQVTAAADSFLQMAGELGVTNRVRLLGFVEDENLAAVYHSAKVFVFPAIAEGFGLPVMEAMTCGLPVLVANAGSLPEITGNAALRFEPGKHEQLADQLSSVLSQPELRAQLSARSLQQAQQFSWNKTADSTASIFRSVANSHKRQPVKKAIRATNSWRWV